MQQEVFNQEIQGVDALNFPVNQVLKSIERGYPVGLFYGDLGAGKTTLIKRICATLGVTSNMSSPTFALVNEYLTQSDTVIYHFDLYRIKDQAELFDLGHEEYFFSGNPCFVEWPEIGKGLYPSKYFTVHIEIVSDDTRKIVINHHG